MLINYAADLGIPAQFTGTLMQRPVEDFQYIETVEQFLSLHVCPIGLERPSIVRAEQAKNVCNHSTGWLDPSAPLLATEITSRNPKRYLLERVQRDMQAVNPCVRKRAC